MLLVLRTRPSATHPEPSQHPVRSKQDYLRPSGIRKPNLHPQDNPHADTQLPSAPEKSNTNQYAPNVPYQNDDPNRGPKPVVLLKQHPQSLRPRHAPLALVFSYPAQPIAKQSSKSQSNTGQLCKCREMPAFMSNSAAKQDPRQYTVLAMEQLPEIEMVRPSITPLPLSPHTK